MKKTLLTPILAALTAALAFIALPNAAEAGHGQRKVSTCGSCGGGIYAIQQFAGRQSCGTPIYRWVTQRHTCSHRSSSHGYSSRGHSSHGHSSHGRSSYGSRYSRGGSSYSGYSRRPSFSFGFGFSRGGSRSCR